MRGRRTTDDGMLGYDDLLNEEGADTGRSDIPNDSPALIMYTSGTTGRPKGAVLTHANLTGQTMTDLFTNGADLNNDVGFVGVPLFHIAGIGNTLTGVLLGSPTVIYPLGAFDPGVFSTCSPPSTSPASSWCPPSGRWCAPNSRPTRAN